VIGNGSNDILELASQAFLGRGCRRCIRPPRLRGLPARHPGAGARGIEVAAKNFGHDLDAMAGGDHPRHPRRLHRQPEQPDRHLRPGDELEAFLAKVPRHVLVVLDEAYTEYLGPEQRYDAIAWLSRFPNLLVSAAPSPRPMAWPACGWATAWAAPRSSTC
jgi:histidinol-phosphate aminotransferase